MVAYVTFTHTITWLQYADGYHTLIAAYVRNASVHYYWITLLL